MEKLLGLLIIFSIVSCLPGIAQSKKATQNHPGYKTYTNNRYHFSFEIPVEWKITSNGDGIDYTCSPITRSEKERFKDYGYVFQIQVKPMNLDSAASMYFRADSGEYYYSPPMGSEKKVERINGNGFTGLHEIHSCRISTKEENGQIDSTVVDGCEQLFLSNGKITLVLDTYGLELEDEDYNRLIKTLRFF